MVSRIALIRPHGYDPGGSCPQTLADWVRSRFFRYRLHLLIRVAHRLRILAWVPNRTQLFKNIETQRFIPVACRVIPWQKQLLCQK